MTGSTKDPDNGPEVAASVFAAVIVYAVRLPIYQSYQIYSLFPHYSYNGCLHLEVKPLVSRTLADSGLHSASSSSADSKPIYMYELAKEEQSH